MAAYQEFAAGIFLISEKYCIFSNDQQAQKKYLETHISDHTSIAFDVRSLDLKGLL